MNQYKTQMASGNLHKKYMKGVVQASERLQEQKEKLEGLKVKQDGLMKVSRGLRMLLRVLEGSGGDFGYIGD